jgi:hypothetical protein
MDFILLGGLSFTSRKLIRKLQNAKKIKNKKKYKKILNIRFLHCR